MISVEEALDRIFSLVTPLSTESVPLRQAAGRVLAAPVTAAVDQPPFAASIMDGYAICDHASAGDSFQVVGESAAGERFIGNLGTGQAVRIFTGAPVPDGAIRVVIQEDVLREGSRITLLDEADQSPYIRPAGADFKAGEAIEAPLVITPSHVALFASMNASHVTVACRPDVAIIATGDELVQPGEMPRPDQIIASNALGLAAMLEGVGATPRLLPIAADTTEALHSAFDLAEGADLVITIGGASVGDRDLVAQVAIERGGRNGAAPRRHAPREAAYGGNGGWCGNDRASGKPRFFNGLRSYLYLAGTSENAGASRGGDAAQTRHAWQSHAAKRAA